MIYTNRGNAYSELKDLNAAFRDYSRAISLNPNSINAYNNRGNIYRSAAQYALAIRDFQVAIALNPSIPTLYVNLGLAYAGAGRKAEDFNELKRAERMGAQGIESAIKSLGLRD